MQPRYISKSLSVAADDNGICTSQTPAGAGNLTIDGALATAGVANLTSQRRVLFTFAADETGRTFVVYGTVEGGKAITETVAGTATTAVTLQDFLTVTRISVDAGTAGAVIVGTNGVGATPWQMVSWGVTPINIGISVIVSGTINYTVSYTLEDPSGTWPNGTALPTGFNISALTSKTTTLDTNLTTPVAAIRLTVNSGTGTANLVIMQSGIAGP